MATTVTHADGATETVPDSTRPDEGGRIADRRGEEVHLCGVAVQVADESTAHVTMTPRAMNCAHCKTFTQIDPERQRSFGRRAFDDFMSRHRACMAETA